MLPRWVDNKRRLLSSEDVKVRLPCLFNACVRACQLGILCPGVCVLLDD
jgi:hypothetical protein